MAEQLLHIFPGSGGSSGGSLAGGSLNTSCSRSRSNRHVSWCSHRRKGRGIGIAGVAFRWAGASWRLCCSGAIRHWRMRITRRVRWCRLAALDLAVRVETMVCLHYCEPPKRSGRNNRNCPGPFGRAPLFGEGWLVCLIGTAVSCRAARKIDQLGKERGLPLDLRTSRVEKTEGSGRQRGLSNEE